MHSTLFKRPLQKKKSRLSTARKAFKDKVIEELPVREENLFNPCILTISTIYCGTIYHQNFVNYRVDRMFRLEVSDADATLTSRLSSLI